MKSKISIENKLLPVALGLVCLTVLLLPNFTFGQSKTIIDEWSSVPVPKAPELKAVTIEPNTALLVLDFVKQTCNTERRPRCLTSIPQVQSLLKMARAKKVLVVH